MPRSAEALARRAAKRGRTTGEQRRADNADASKRRKLQRCERKERRALREELGDVAAGGVDRSVRAQSEMSTAKNRVKRGPSTKTEAREAKPAPALSIQEQLEKQRKEAEAERTAPRKPKNAASGSSRGSSNAKKSVSNRNYAIEKTGAKQNVPTGETSATSEWECVCGTKNFDSRFRCRDCKRKRRGDKTWVDPKVASSWGGVESSVSAEKATRNEFLRKQYHADPTKLSASDLERAKVLVERTRRKKERKARRKNFKKGGRKRR